MKYNFSKIKLKDIDGNELPLDVPFYKEFANFLHQTVSDLDLLEKVFDINKGKEVELNELEKQKLVDFIKAETTPLLAISKKAVLDYIESVK